MVVCDGMCHMWCLLFDKHDFKLTKAIISFLSHVKMEKGLTSVAKEKI